MVIVFRFVVFLVVLLATTHASARIDERATHVWTFEHMLAGCMQARTHELRVTDEEVEH